MAVTNTQNINITATANVSGASSGIQTVNIDIQKLGMNVENTRSKMQGLSSSVKNLLQLFSLWSAYHIGKEQFAGLMEVAAQFEKLDYAMTRFVGKGQDFTEAMAWIEKLGRSSYGISNVEKAFVQLNAVGMKPTSAQMEGLVGYLLTIGRTGEHELGKVVGKMTELYQLGNVGLDDALKELSREIPFAMDALAHKLKINPLDLFMRDFKNRSIDFGTIIKAIFEYAEEYFKSGVGDTQNFWGVLMLRWKAGVEAFRRDIAQSGIFDQVRSWISGLIQEMDRLQAEGKLATWARRISDALSRLFEGMGAGKVTVEELGEKIVKVVQDIGKLGPTIRGAITAVGDLAAALGSILTLYGQVPDSVKGPLGWGIVGGMLFGAYGAMIASILAAVKDFQATAEKNGWATPTNSQTMNALNPSIGGLGIAYGQDSTGGDQVTVEGRKIWRSRSLNGGYSYTFPNTDGSMGYTTDLSLAYAKTKEFYAKGGQAIGEAIKEGQKKYEDTVNSKIKSGGSTMPEDVLRLMNAAVPFEKTMKSHYDALLRNEAVAGLEGFEKDRAALWAKRYEYEEAFNKAFENEKRAAETYWSKGNYKESIKIMDELAKKYDEYDSMFNSALEKKKNEWLAKDADKLARNTVGIQDINQNIADTIKKLHSYARETERLEGEAGVVEAKGYSASTLAQIKQIQNEASLEADKINDWARDLEKQMNEIYDKLTRYGKTVSPEAGEAYNWLVDYVQGIKEIMQRAREAVQQKAVWEIDVAKAIGTGETELREMTLLSKYKELTGSIKEQSAAKLGLIEATERLEWLRAKSNSERNLIVEIANYQKWLEKMKQVGTEIDGLRYGLWEAGRTAATAWDTGIEMAKRMKTAFDDLAGAISELAVTGKADFASLAQSIIKDLLKMMIQATITNRIFGWLASTFGLSGSTGSINADLVGSSIKYHEGGFVGWPRYHSGGLAYDEVPAILQRGEYVVPKNKVGNLGASFTTQINVTAPTPTGGSASADAKQMEDYGHVIAGIVKTEFNKNLMEQMRPGGLLNKGVNS